MNLRVFPVNLDRGLDHFSCVIPRVELVFSVNHDGSVACSSVVAKVVPRLIRS